MTCILVVDDEPAVLKVLVTRLNLAGYQVLSAQDGEQALEVFHKEAPDLVVLDVMLPKICLLYTSPSPRDQRGSGMACCG